MRLSYCAARDYDSASCAENREWTSFYIARAQSYEAEMRALLS
jgi:hypothetical protein